LHDGASLKNIVVSNYELSLNPSLEKRGTSEILAQNLPFSSQEKGSGEEFLFDADSTIEVGTWLRHVHVYYCRPLICSLDFAIPTADTTESRRYQIVNLELKPHKPQTSNL
jgi:hypothetical protein